MQTECTSIEVEVENEVEKDLNNNTFNPEKKFEEAWTVYPKEGRIKKKMAKRHYLATVKTQEDHERLIVGIKNYIASVESRRANGHQSLQWQNASTWFNDWQSWPDKGPHEYLTAEEKTKRAEAEEAKKPPKIEMSEEDCGIWFKGVLPCIAEKIPEESYRSWFSPTVFKRDGPVGIVGVPNTFYKECLEENYHDLTLTVLREVNSQIEKLEFMVCATH